MTHTLCGIVVVCLCISKLWSASLLSCLLAFACFCLLLLACLLACLPACLLACLPVCLLACLPACLLACLPACEGTHREAQSQSRNMREAPQSEHHLKGNHPKGNHPQPKGAKGHTPNYGSFSPVGDTMSIACRDSNVDTVPCGLKPTK